MNNFHYINVLLDSFYGIEMGNEEVEEMGLIAWGRIGNRNTKLYKYTACINPHDLSVTLPCNAAMDDQGRKCVELVTTQWEDWSTVTNYSENGDNNTSFIETQIESEKQYQSAYYLPGKVLKFEEVGDKLYFTHNYGKVNILYKGIIADEEGLPELSDKEAMAIATFIAYSEKFKEGLRTNNQNITNQAIQLQKIWLQQCDQARVTSLNQNDMNQILEIKGSWDRSAYGRGYKGLK